jgi:multisubunit Na+/H+ antiporter MnhE subunit
MARGNRSGVSLSDRGHRLAMWIVRWALLAALWLALTDTHKSPELAAGAVAAAIGATFAGIVTRPGPPRTMAASLALLRLGPRRLGRPLVRLVADTALLAAALWRHLVRRRTVRGVFRAVRRPREARLDSAAGRAVVESWGSLSPNRYVIGLDDQNVLLVHELVRTDAPLHPLDRA